MHVELNMFHLNIYHLFEILLWVVHVYLWACILKWPLFQEMILTSEVFFNVLFFSWFMKFKCLGTISLCYLNKQNYSNKLISQSSTFTSNSASVCSLHSGQNNQTKANLILLHLCLTYSPCSYVLKMADEVLTSSRPHLPRAQPGTAVLWRLIVTPRLLHRSSRLLFPRWMLHILLLSFLL